ncbi:MAG: efflux RND transporter periplasmic adaptor subunit, partial [Verrucomicrobia bacterium]|nr:efflux RND transporter periplasmic adaptor subunit [Verrucomicrobiota bacterium]
TECFAEGKIANDDDTTTNVLSPYSGRVSKIYVKAGDTVKQGDPLLDLQASEFVQAQNDLVAALGTSTTAQAQLNLARTTEKRQHDLYDAKGGALKDWQQSQVDLANAEAGLKSAQIALAAVRGRLRILGQSDEEIAALEKEPDRLSVLARATVPSPIAGIVTQRQVGLGQYINSAANGGSTPVFSINDLTKVWLLANVREVDAPSMKLGADVQVLVLAFPERVFRAKLVYVAAAIDPTTHRLPVRAEVDNPDSALKPEMFASFTIITGASVEMPAVPESAVIYEGSSAHVWIALPDHNLELREIKAGRTRDGMVEVLSGLKDANSVVTSGSLFIDRAVASE